jgi:tripeptidyl-peptidase-1
MPAWQKKVVESYTVNLDGEYDGLYNKSGRAYPDTAALGQIYATVWNGSVIQVDGTSASTPAASGVLTRVNDALIAAGKPTFGLINPWLYAHGHKAFADVVNGSSAGCDTDRFPAKVGWDAATGWGSPYFPDFVEFLGVGEGSKEWQDW